MDPFIKLKGAAAPLAMINVDTDMIVPKNFMKTIRKSGLGKALFAQIRYEEDGTERRDFVLNQQPFRGAPILITGANFGCGSSREHAPWALRDFGVRCVIAPSFADIFYSNTLKNGMLPLRLPEERVNGLLRFTMELPGAEIAIDLEDQTIKGPDGRIDQFSLDPFHKHCLLNGVDEIALTLSRKNKISDFEEKQKNSRFWLYNSAIHSEMPSRATVSSVGYSKSAR